MNRILAGSGLVCLAWWRFVAARASIFGMPDRPWQSQSRPNFTAAVVLLGSSITRTRRQATRHYLLFRWSIARSHVTRHCVLRALVEPVVFQVSQAVENSPITLRVWSLMTVDSGKAPPNDNESAILGLLAPANYIAIVAGRNGTTSVALIEFYGSP